MVKSINVKEDRTDRKQKDYTWRKYNIFTRWLHKRNQTILIVFDAKDVIKERLPGLLLEGLDASRFHDPFWVYALLFEDVIRLQDDAIWVVRDRVRAIEKNRPLREKPEIDYTELHDLSRHAIHVSETPDLSVKTVSSIVAQHKQLSDRHRARGESNTVTMHIQDRLLFHEHMLFSLQCRAASNKEHLTNEIGLAFNTVAQYDSRVAVKIGRAAQTDTSAMRTIAFLTLVFLPATFISAVFSTSFFDYDAVRDKWSAPSKFWLYWAFAAPVTIITASCWWVFTNLYPPRLLGDEAEQPRGAKLVKEKVKGFKKEIREKFRRRDDVDKESLVNSRA